MSRNPIFNSMISPVRVLLYGIALLGLWILSAQHLTAQEALSSVRGRVVEQNNPTVPVEFATVQVLPQGSATTTNGNGEFFFDRLLPGRINLKIEFLGMEPIDTTFTLSAGKHQEMIFRIQESTFRLTEITVVAKESKAGRATASTISRQAMDHLQTSSLSDIMQLLPGGVTSYEGGLSTAKTFNIRSLGASPLNKGVPISTNAANMNSMGTAIVIDGAPLSNNANLQTLSPAISGGGGSIGGGSSPNSGLDIRSISTDNIESVEVIRGIPSVEHGDLTSGAVIIKSKAGREPLTIRLKTDPSIYQASVSKGVSLGKERGNLNVSGDYAYSIKDAKESYAYYQRATARAMYSNRFNKLSSNTSFDFSLGKDTRERNPDDERSQLETGARDIGLRFNTNGTWNIRKGWLSNVKYTLSGSYRDKHSYQKKLLGNAFAAYSMSNTDGAVLSNRPGQKVYDNEGRELTNIPDGEASLIATYLPNEYFSRYDIYGKEVNLFANLNASFSKTLGAVNNRILLGANFRSDGNLGDGKVYDPYNPPSRSLSSENSSPRPRKYSSIPFINQLSLYGEENLTWSIGERELLAQAGLRYDLVNSKSIVTPRTNLSFDILPRKLWLRGGFGVTAKAPTTLYLYPENAYFDLVHFNSLNSSSVPENEQLFLSTTRVFNTRNRELKMAANQKAEIGLDLMVNRMRFSVTAYNEQLKNGYNLATTIDSYHLLDYIIYEEAAQNPGTIPTLREKERHNIFVSHATPSNDGRSHNRGVEFDFDFGRIHAIRTSFVLNGAYMRSTDWSDGHSFSNRKNLNELERNVGIYEKGNEKYERERFTTTLRATHNIPSIGFVLTTTAQVSWLNKYWTSYGNDTTFVSYISREDGSVKPFDDSKRDDPEFAYLFETRSPTRFIAESYFPVLLINFHLTKEIGENLKASFYANNMFNSRPLYESKRTPGSFTRLNIPMYFGFELALQLK
ncbi:MAG: TonB-dependent receptor plug domain-containing protein [Proteiniphilum sp.]|nr:TonB-dependent receptor plug domain-containing protein [Proteiniphilum sp.]MDD4416125.1 TonB-dependent receptor plug domain-containing protein [Proteiniphilum sp.]